jgi:uncharacterized membrane protein YbaN (DUF454 family)
MEHMQGTDSDRSNEVKSRIIRSILIVAGTFFLILGAIGIVLPILPTTPFLLLAAACYARGSKKFYNWLINNKRFGKFIKNYREGKGIPIRAKALAISFLWIAMIITMLFFVTNIILRVVLIIISIGVSIHLLTIQTFNE